MRNLFIKPLFSSWVVWYAIILHTVWGLLLVGGSTSAKDVTAIHTLYLLVPNGPLLGLVLFGVGAAALAALLSDRAGTMSLCLLLPQQAALVVAAVGACDAMFNGRFADGTQRPVPFLVADQLPAVMAAVMHTVAVVYSHWGRYASS